MCGFAGFIDSRSQRGRQDLEHICRAMNQTLAHRGPDDSGQWVDPGSGVALGHRRLSIIDLSPAGSQPMLSHDGNLVLAYNGEVYNFETLRRRLESADPELAGRWRGRSDSEVLLQAIAAWGLEKALQEANGMFALALWDRRAKRLFLARDRMGQKPLYYGWAEGSLMFASELKALAPHPDFQGQMDRRALAAYVRHGYVPAPHCIFQGLRKLTPGCFICLDPTQRQVLPEPQAYWSLGQAMARGLADPLTGPPQEAATRLEELLGDAVHMRMVSDVPLGALLSGGIDSSTVVALMGQRSSLPVRTFSIGFNQAGHDEAPFARQVAKHLGTEHTELYVSPGQALDVVPLLPTIYDEPFGDSSQIPSYLVS
ncbi:MAG: asparagine synthase (glutamine-hydrolyzing), partial [Desulfarculaceae bacterium]|nr:asparagine synthase (glutamine-hydrolyzing) [Desulfarculaceae bacterium]